MFSTISKPHLSFHDLVKLLHTKLMFFVFMADQCDVIHIHSHESFRERKCQYLHLYLYLFRYSLITSTAHQNEINRFCNHTKDGSQLQKDESYFHNMFFYSWNALSTLRLHRLIYPTFIFFYFFFSR